MSDAFAASKYLTADALCFWHLTAPLNVFSITIYGDLSSPIAQSLGSIKRIVKHDA